MLPMTGRFGNFGVLRLVAALDRSQPLQKSKAVTSHRTPKVALALCVAVLLISSHPCIAEEPATSIPIPESKIAALQKELTQQTKATSSIRKRRACKSIVRSGEALLKASPDAPNRYPVLGIVFQAQKRLLLLENTERNRQALFAMCSQLAKAPAEHAELRLEADMLLSERALSAGNADVKERARALEEMIQRYRDTPGEAKSLMMAVRIAPKLEAFDLELQILRTMEERFANHHGVIEFSRKSLGFGRLEALFHGTFKRHDGATLSFPVDRMGHLCIMVFWSKQTQGIEEALKQINEHEKLYPGRFDFFSFNLDELPDAGESTLRALGLDWTAMRLPGGRKNQAFRTYGQREPVAILVNAYGRVLLTPGTSYGRGHTAAANPYKFNDVRISDERYLSQLQSLFIGDFLAAGSDSPKSANSVPAETLRKMQDCFTPIPLRYRLTRKEALANYEKAEQLCVETITQNPKAANLWLVRNRRIIALLGMWNLAAEPKYLDEAVKESRISLAAQLPRRADVVPRFCLVKNELRGPDAHAKSILADFIEATGGADAPGSAFAAAVILSLDANSRELHHHYRKLLLERDDRDPTLWPVVTFLRDRYHTLDLLRVKLARPERRIRARYGDVIWPRSHLINHGLEPMTNRLPSIELKTLDGGTMNLPEDSEGKLTLLVFVEPPADPKARFPQTIGGAIDERSKKNRPGVMQWAIERGDLHIHKEVRVIAAFLSDDAERVKALMKEYKWPCQAALVPSGLGNPLVSQLGILSADRIPNIFLLRRDGTVAWSISGFNCKRDFGYPFAILLAMKVHIEVCDTELAYKALAKGDFQEAASIFSGPFLPVKDERYRWAGPRFHGRALANMGLKKWDAALADIDTAIAAHQKGFRHAKLQPCQSMVEMQLTKATILEKLGRTEEARATREYAATPTAQYPETLYDLFHARLRELNIKERK